MLRVPKDRSWNFSLSFADLLLFKIPSLPSWNYSSFFLWFVVALSGLGAAPPSAKDTFDDPYLAFGVVSFPPPFHPTNGNRHFVYS